MDLVIIWRLKAVFERRERLLANWAFDLDLAPISQALVAEYVAARGLRFILRKFQTYSACAVAEINLCCRSRLFGRSHLYRLRVNRREM